MIRVQCPKCAWRFAVEDEMRGRQDRCPQCATPVPVATDAGGDAPEVPTVASWATLTRTPLSEIDDKLRPEFNNYLAALSAGVHRLNLFPVAGPGIDLIVLVTLGTGGKANFDVMTQPMEAMLDTAGLAELFRALFAVRTPATRGPAAEATLVFAVRGGSGQLQRPGEDPLPRGV
ncbi:MAG: zinc-ribbon domain-containing protein [Planctomycetes bacterium]|nr:zinc-ribbon domain-containing protein [Planctomycetota bacterium]